MVTFERDLNTLKATWKPLGRMGERLMELGDHSKGEWDTQASESFSWEPGRRNRD
jgi:hypothetical protein